MLFRSLPEPLYFYREFESFSLPHYLRAKLDLAALQWRVRSKFGGGAASWAALMQYVRAAVYLGGCAAGLEHYLIRRRSRPPDQAARDLLHSALPRILEHTASAFGASAVQGIAAAPPAQTAPQPAGNLLGDALAVE